MRIAKREMTDREKREQLQARVGLASNILGLAAGGAALVAAAKNPALRNPVLEHAGPVTGKLAPHLKEPMRGHLIRAGAAGALGLQGANIAGDVVANRVLSREANKEKKTMGARTVEASKSIEQSLVSKSVEVRVTGRGVNLSKATTMADLDDYRLYDDKNFRTVVQAGRLRQLREDYQSAKALNADLKNGEKIVVKRYFDAEDERQRRLGLYTGAGVVGGLASGLYAGQGLKFERVKEGKDAVTRRGVKVTAPAGSAKKKAAAAAASLGLLTGSALLHRHSVSDRNQRWS